jgi:hypothetical protein
MMMVMAVVMMTACSVSRNNRTNQDNKCDHTKKQIANLHRDTPPRETPTAFGG